MKKRFMLFAGNDYYPNGGAYDFVGSYPSIEKCLEAHQPSEYTYEGGWANIFDCKSQKIVKQYSRGLWIDGDGDFY